MNRMPIGIVVLLIISLEMSALRLGYDIGKQTADKWYANHPLRTVYMSIGGTAVCVTYVDANGNETPSTPNTCLAVKKFVDK